MHIRGVWRLYTEFRFGTTGSQGPKNVQAFIHRDLVSKSKKILLWENQIENGGRYIFNYTVQHDWRISAKSWRKNNDSWSRNIKDQEYGKNTSNLNAKWGFHLYWQNTLNLGTELTSYTTGLRWQNRSMRDVNGLGEVLHNTMQIRPRTCPYFKRYMFLSAEAKFHYIWHNSMLEGVGFGKTFPNDAYDDDKPSYRILNDPRRAMKGDPDEVERIVFSTRLQATFRFKNSSLTYAINFLSPELSEELSERKWHGYGTLGFNFIL
jgi:hypothetical protein